MRSSHFCLLKTAMLEAWRLFKGKNMSRANLRQPENH